MGKTVKFNTKMCVNGLICVPKKIREEMGLEHRDFVRVSILKIEVPENEGS